MVACAAVPSRIQQVSILLLAAALVAAGVAGGQWFMEANYVVFGYLDQEEWSVDSGYTVGEFWGLVLQTLCLPAAAAAFMSFSLHSYKSSAWPSWVKATTYFSLLVLLAVCASIANDTMTQGLVDCLWSLCQDVSTSSTSEAFTAFIPATGTMYFSVLVMFSCLVGVLLARTSLDVARRCYASKKSGLGVADFGSKEESQPLMARPAAASTGTSMGGGSSSSTLGGGGSRFSSRQHSTMSSTFQVDSMEQERRRTRRLLTLLWVIGVLCCFFPLFIFASMSIDDGWEGLTAADVKTYASSSASQSYGTIWNLHLSSSLILKLFPDVLIYWSFMYLLVVVALVARKWTRLERFFHAPFRPFGGRLRPRQAAFSRLGVDYGPSSSPCSPSFGWKNGEAFLAIMFFALLLCEGLYWYLDHGWGGAAIDSKTWQERFARTMGQLANITMGLMILPVLRNGVFEKVFGVGWESMVAFHRRMSRVFLALVLVHMLFFWVVYAQSGDFWHDWPIAIPTDYHYDNWTIPLATLTTWVMVIAMFVLSVQWVRRQYFEVFYYAHHFFLVVWAMMLWHAASAWYYICASITLWVFDRAIRFSKGLTIVSVKELSSVGAVTRLAYTVESGGIGPWGGAPRAMLHEAGQYCFINVPAISLLEWHPFTISSSPDDRETTHHIKDMGPKTFTGKLRMLATLGSQVQVNVDGPYGFPLEYDRYRLLVLVAGGIGVTPCLSLLRHLSLLARAGSLSHCLEDGVRLIWSTRSTEEMLMLEAELRDVVGEGGESGILAGGRFSVHLHLTSPPGMRRTTTLPFAEGRPDLCSYLQRFGREIIVPGQQQQQQQQQQKGAGLVFACGPKALLGDASRAAGAAGLSFHAETFEL
eukprot:g7118.t1